MPVFVGRPAPVAAGGIGAMRAAAEAVPDRVRVEVLARARAEALNIPGVLLRLDRADGKPVAGNADLVVDYSAFRSAYGAGYGRRLRIVRYPACVLTTPKQRGCALGTEVPTRNDTANRQLVAEVTVEPPAGEKPRSGSELTLSAGSGAVFAVMASSSSGGGSYAAQPLS
ncbi:MAG TPA: hypothetical protein VFR67_14700, partial [Pilimelia sp.]|nr:hypothetical protein [Pilimelia sp.]